MSELVEQATLSPTGNKVACKACLEMSELDSLTIFYQDEEFIVFIGSENSDILLAHRRHNGVSGFEGRVRLFGLAVERSKKVAKILGWGEWDLLVKGGVFDEGHFFLRLIQAG